MFKTKKLYENINKTPGKNRYDLVALANNMEKENYEDFKYRRLYLVVLITSITLWTVLFVFTLHFC